jgi:hypothetical protein
MFATREADKAQSPDPASEESGVVIRAFGIPVEIDAANFFGGMTSVRNPTARAERVWSKETAG